MDLIVVGSIGLDDVETPFGKVEYALGGSAIFFSLAASYLAQTGLVGVVGTDFPEHGRKMLLDHGVDLAGMETKEGNTFRWAGVYGEDLNSRETLLTELNVFEEFKPELDADYSQSPFVFLGNIHPSLQLDVIDQCKDAKFVALDTMNFWIEGALDELKMVLKRIDCLIINDSEARELSGEHNIVKAAEAVAAMGPTWVVVKRGEYGALLFHEGKMNFCPAFPLANVIDPTGAGDTFAGGFMGHIARAGEATWDSMTQAVLVGSALASYCVEDFSTQKLASLNVDMIEERIRAFRQLAFIPDMPELPR